MLCEKRSHTADTLPPTGVGYLMSPGYSCGLAATKLQVAHSEKRQCLLVWAGRPH